VEHGGAVPGFGFADHTVDLDLRGEQVAQQVPTAHQPWDRRAQHCVIGGVKDSHDPRRRRHGHTGKVEVDGIVEQPLNGDPHGMDTVTDGSMEVYLDVVRERERHRLGEAAIEAGPPLGIGTIGPHRHQHLNGSIDVATSHHQIQVPEGTQTGLELVQMRHRRPFDHPQVRDPRDSETLGHVAQAILQLHAPRQGVEVVALQQIYLGFPQQNGARLRRRHERTGQPFNPNRLHQRNPQVAPVDRLAPRLAPLDHGRSRGHQMFELGPEPVVHRLITVDQHRHPPHAGEVPPRQGPPPT